MTGRREDFHKRSGRYHHLEIPALEPFYSFSRDCGSSEVCCLGWGYHVAGNSSLHFIPHADERFTVFSCGHVIPKENLAAFVINKGPGGSVMEFKMASRSDKSLVISL